MTIDEAIYCMKSYLPDNRISCQDCKYYGSKDEGDGVFTCQSFAAHELAIKALTAQLKMGRWVEDVAYYAEDGCPCIITRCDQCGEPNPVSKFCPNCGARMEEK